MEHARVPYRKHLFVCTNRREVGSCCAANGSEPIRDALKEYVDRHGLKGVVRISQTGCQGLCDEGPNVMVWPDGLWYHHVSMEDVPALIREHLEPFEAERAERR